MIEYNDEIVSIEEVGIDEMIDIEVNKNHFFYANDILTKNSYGLPATADFMAIMGVDEDNIIYQNELGCKIVKNRIGGRVGEIFKLYYDARSLKMYDETEMDQWIQDRQISGDEREAAQIQRGQRRNR